MRAVWLALTLALAGCIKVGPDYQPPALEFIGRQAGGRADQAAKPEPPPTLARWWRQFNDSELDWLMDAALRHNLDLQQTLANIKDLRAQRRAIFGGALPELSASSRVSRMLNAAGGGAAAGMGPGAGFGIGNLINIFQTGFDAHWELDFFGGVQRALEAADATLDGAAANRHAVQVTLLAEVATHYLRLRENQQLCAITQSLLASFGQTLALTQILQQSGLSTQMEVSKAQAQLAAIEAQLPLCQSQTAQAMHALAVLLAKPPGHLAPRLAKAGAIPQPAAAPWPDMPSQLLKRRPDLLRAERQLAAASAQIGVATAALYPKLNLSAFLGLQNTRITDVTPLGKSWSTAASLTFPLFNWGELRAQVNSRQAQAEQQQLAYRQAVLTALKEVEDAVAAYQQELRRKQALADAVAANLEAVALATERYQAGMASFLDVLTSQQALFQAQSQLASSQAAAATHLAALYKALGGGWES